MEIHKTAAAAQMDSKPELLTTDIQGVIRGRKATIDNKLSNEEDDFLFAQSGKDEPDLEEAQHKANLLRQTRQMERSSQATMEELLPDLEGNPAFQRYMTGLRRKPKSERDLEKMQNYVESLFEDASHQHAAVVAAKKVLDREGGDPELRESLAELETKLMKEKGPEIKAGYNVSRLARGLVGKSAEGIQTLRDFYRDFVFGERSVFESYKFIMEEFPEIQDKGHNAA